MKAIDIPFVKLIGISEEDKNLSLAFKDDVLNHIKTIHASAQFTLAETKSGLHLLSLFPKLKGKVVPVLRDANIKYKKPALKKIFAFASTNEEDIQKFKTQFEKKGRGSLKIKVEIRDINDVLTCSSEFSWFVQAL